MDTFQSELGTEFRVQHEGKHVVPKSNFLAMNLTAGPSGHSFNAGIGVISTASISRVYIWRNCFILVFYPFENVSAYPSSLTLIVSIIFYSLTLFHTKKGNIKFQDTRTRRLLNFKTISEMWFARRAHSFLMGCWFSSPATGFWRRYLNDGTQPACGTKFLAIRSSSLNRGGAIAMLSMRYVLVFTVNFIKFCINL